MKKTKSISKLKKEADILFSRYIRQSYANDFGMVACYTCPAIKPVSEMQNGHFVSRAHLNTRYDEANCRPQCVGCNVFKNGNYTEFAFRLLKEVGQKGLEELEAKKRVIKQIRRKDYLEIIAKYSALGKS